jgi:hypothetical protein
MKLSECKIGTIVIDHSGRVGQIIGIKLNISRNLCAGESNEELAH